MQETFNAPAQVNDDLPTLRSELGNWWDKYFKQFIDFKTFLRQRRAILSNQEAARCAQKPYTDWKNPFEFALSASTLTFAVVALIGIAFHTVFPDPDLKNDWIARNLRTQLAAVELRSQHTNARGPAHAVLMEERDRIVTDLQDHVSGLTVPHEGILATAGAPLVIYFLGVLFPRFIRRQATAAPYASASREIVYYYFTARTFWPAFLLVTGGAIVFFLMKYSLWNEYDEIPQILPVNHGPLFFLIGAIASIGTVLVLYALVATPIAFHRCAREISGVLGVADPSGRRAIYWGLVKSIIVGSFLAYTLAMVLILGYMAFDQGTQAIKTSTGTALSITSAASR